MADRQHEVLRDATLTFAHILKTHLPPNLEKKNPIDLVFEVPEAKRVEKARADGKVLISIILIDATKSTIHQTTEEPIVREETETGEIVEYRMGPPTFIFPRYMITPWTGDPLFDQVVMGLVMRLFFTRSTFLPEDIQGNTIAGESKPPIMMVESFGLEKQMKLWQVMGHPYRPSVVYGVNLRMDSMRKSLVRRVKERVLDFKKLEG
jgi:hypothetical protein